MIKRNMMIKRNINMMCIVAKWVLLSIVGIYLIRWSSNWLWIIERMLTGETTPENDVPFINFLFMWVTGMVSFLYCSPALFKRIAIIFLVTRVVIISLLYVGLHITLTLYIAGTVAVFLNRYLSGQKVLSFQAVIPVVIMLLGVSLFKLALDLGVREVLTNIVYTELVPFIPDMIALISCMIPLGTLDYMREIYILASQPVSQGCLHIQPSSRQGGQNITTSGQASGNNLQSQPSEMRPRPIRPRAPVENGIDNISREHFVDHTYQNTQRYDYNPYYGSYPFYGAHPSYSPYPSYGPYDPTTARHPSMRGAPVANQWYPRMEAPQPSNPMYPGPYMPSGGFSPQAMNYGIPSHVMPKPDIGPCFCYPTSPKGWNPFPSDDREPLSIASGSAGESANRIPIVEIIEARSSGKKNRGANQLGFSAISEVFNVPGSAPVASDAGEVLSEKAQGKRPIVEEGQNTVLSEKAQGKRPLAEAVQKAVLGKRPMLESPVGQPSNKRVMTSQIDANTQSLFSSMVHTFDESQGNPDFNSAIYNNYDAASSTPPIPSISDSAKILMETFFKSNPISTESHISLMLSITRRVDFCKAMFNNEDWRQLGFRSIGLTMIELQSHPQAMRMFKELYPRGLTVFGTLLHSAEFLEANLYSDNSYDATTPYPNIYAMTSILIQHTNTTPINALMREHIITRSEILTELSINRIAGLKRGINRMEGLGRDLQAEIISLLDEDEDRIRSRLEKAQQYNSDVRRLPYTREWHFNNPNS